MEKTVQHYCLLFFILLLMVCKPLPAFSAPHTINALKVAYIYNIAKFTRWPAATWDSPTAPFQLCFYSEEKVYDGLQVLEKKEVNGHPIRLIKANKGSDFQQCNAFYINTSERHRYRYLLSLIDQQTVLVISDDSPFFDYGGLINLVKKKQRLRFQVNTRQLAHSQLKFSSKLLKLAILIDK